MREIRLLNSHCINFKQKILDMEHELLHKLQDAQLNKEKILRDMEKKTDDLEEGY